MLESSGLLLSHLNFFGGLEGTSRELWCDCSPSSMRSGSKLRLLLRAVPPLPPERATSLIVVVLCVHVQERKCNAAGAGKDLPFTVMNSDAVFCLKHLDKPEKKGTLLLSGSSCETYDAKLAEVGLKL